MILRYGDRSKEFSKGYEWSTNNRMELMGVIFGLEQLKVVARVEVYSDSQYVVRAMTEGWAVRWRDNNWWKNRKERAANIDLWVRLLELSDLHELNFHWIKGHNGHPENERCDQLATIALQGTELLRDDEYLEIIRNSPRTWKVKMEGDLCRKCEVPVVKRMGRKKKKRGRSYYFAYHLYCPECTTTYFTEDAKTFEDQQDKTLFD